MGQPFAKRCSGQQVFSKDSVRELFNLLERTVEFNINDITIYVYNGGGSVLTTLRKTWRSKNELMSDLIISQSEVRR
jgi:hypothetical protein